MAPSVEMTWFFIDESDSNFPHKVLLFFIWRNIHAKVDSAEIEFVIIQAEDVSFSPLIKSSFELELVVF